MTPPTHPPFSPSISNWTSTQHSCLDYHYFSCNFMMIVGIPVITSVWPLSTRVRPLDVLAWPLTWPFCGWVKGHGRRLGSCSQEVVASFVKVTPSWSRVLLYKIIQKRRERWCSQKSVCMYASEESWWLVIRWWRQHHHEDTDGGITVWQLPGSSWPLLTPASCFEAILWLRCYCWSPSPLYGGRGSGHSYRY